MNSITLAAPAKVNLFLKVLDRRPDGYHNILTLFERVSLADEIKISKIPSGIVVSSDKFITANPKDNLVYKAAELILRYIKVDKGLKGKEKGLKGVAIRVKKSIPVAAGLGGGSSDAASVLIGINKLYNIQLETSNLMKLGKKLGADVPFFILKTPFAIGKSTGDKLEKLATKARLWHIIVSPGPKSSTRRIYEAFDASTNPSTSSGFVPSVSRGTKCLTTDFDDDKINPVLKRSMDFNAAESMLYNNLEEIVISKKPVIGTILERLASSAARRSIVAGSGPSVFCLCVSRKEAIEAKRKFLGSIPARNRMGWQVFIAKTGS
ncbi:MAG: 4-(cytidine 5'-diphospho)-2-C-methyl-D-erythritol kinase [Candidatus Omnitrophota bacterium]